MAATRRADGKRLLASHKPPIPLPKDIDLFSLVFALSSAHPDRPAVSDPAAGVAYSYGEVGACFFLLSSFFLSFFFLSSFFLLSSFFFLSFFFRSSFVLLRRD
jgi:hypothetical protein